MDVTKFKNNKQQGLVIILAIFGTLLLIRHFSSAEDKEKVRAMERFMMNEFPSGTRPLPKKLIKHTSFKSKKELAELDEELFDEAFSTAIMVTRAYCARLDEAYTKSEAIDITKEQTKETLKAQKELYTKSDYQSIYIIKRKNRTIVNAKKSLFSPAL